MKYYLVGIKGSGMSALACILKNLNNEVSGSDSTNYYFTQQKLEENNIEMLTYDAANITNDIDIVIVGNAISSDNVEVIKAKELNLVTKSYKEVVADLAKDFTSVAIAGTNGKTTTTALNAAMLGDMEKIVLIGDGTGYADATAKMFLFEACEYQNTFHVYKPTIGLINNIVMDHPDFFTSDEMLIDSFQTFANGCEKIIVNLDCEMSKQITHANKYTFSIKDSSANYFFNNIVQTSSGFTAELFINNKLVKTVSFPFYATHMYSNTLATIAIGDLLGIDMDAILNNILTFKGAKRRFEIEVIDSEKEIVIIDDYAHHPTAIDVTIDAIRQKYPDYTLNLCFQPHTYSRVESFLGDFAISLAKADNVYLQDIFGSVREKTSEVNLDVMINEIKKYKDVVYTDLSFIDTTKEKQIYAILGAGDINNILIPQIKNLY